MATKILRWLNILAIDTLGIIYRLVQFLKKHNEKHCFAGLSIWWQSLGMPQTQYFCQLLGIPYRLVKMYGDYSFGKKRTDNEKYRVEFCRYGMVMASEMLVCFNIFIIYSVKISDDCAFDKKTHWNQFCRYVNLMAIEILVCLNIFVIYSDTDYRFVKKTQRKTLSFAGMFATKISVCYQKYFLSVTWHINYIQYFFCHKLYFLWVTHFMDV